MNQPSATVIGTGALGSTLVKALHENGYSITGLFNRTPKKAEALSAGVNANKISEFPATKEELGSLTFITVQDSEIAKIATRLSKLSDDFTGFSFIHCSGSESANILEPLKQKGARIAAFHPLQTFTSHSTPRDFENIYFDVEADERTFEMLRKVATSLGGQMLNVSAEAKPYLHAAAVVASNYLVALLDASGKMASLGGINEDEALKALLPLVRKTLENVESENTIDALTGPIKRGDVETVRKHLELLNQNENLLTLYKKLGLQTLQIATRGQKLSEQKHAELYELLKEDE